MAFLVIVCMIRDRCQQKKVKGNEISHVETQAPIIVVKKVFTKKHSSVREVFKENTPSQFKTICIS